METFNKIPPIRDRRNFKMDKKDLELLYQLDLNCRQSNPQLARKLRLSPEVVYHRIKRLEREKIIEYYYATIDPSTFGYEGYRVYLKTEDLSLEKEQEMIDWLVQRQETWWVIRVEGAWQIDILLWVKGKYDFERFWSEFNRHFRRHVQSKLVMIYTHLYHFHRPYLIDASKDEEKEDVLFSDIRIKLDKTDFLILRHIATNARISLVDLSKKAGISPKNIAFRLRKLLQNRVILSFRAKIDLEKLGYKYYKIEINLHDATRTRELYTYAKYHPNITYINQVIGLADFDADVEVKDHNQFMQIITELRKRFGGIIRDYSYFTLTRVHKISYFPAIE